MLGHVVVIAALVSALGALPVAAQESPVDIVAEAIRDHRQPCSGPVDAERDIEASSPHEEAWTIRSDEGRYRVTFMGDTGAEVTAIGG